MTKHLHRIRAALRAQLLERGLPLRLPLPPAARDGYAALWIWGQSGEIVERLTPEQIMASRSGLPMDMPLADAPTRARGVAYQLAQRAEWIVLARAAAAEPIVVHEPHALGYAEPTLVYLTEVEGTWASGCVNLSSSPTPRQLRIAPGRHYSELWSTPLDRADIETEMLRLAQVLPHFYATHAPTP